MEWCDLHCHVLPGVDDGCKTCEESVEALRQSAVQGVAGMILTPHYNPKETVERFLERRQVAFGLLQETLKESKEGVPRVCLGAEVAYHTGLVYKENLGRLCLGSSKYLLLELPFVRWSPGVLRDVSSLRSIHGVVPMIAHLERYLNIQERSTIEKLLNMDVLVQMNAEALLGFWDGRKARQMLKAGMVQVLCSDCHNLTSRPPNLGSIVQQLHGAGMQEALEEVCWNGQKIFQAAFAGSRALQ